MRANEDYVHLSLKTAAVKEAEERVNKFTLLLC